MAPVALDCDSANHSSMTSELDPETIVISGMSGKFPKSLFIKDFEEILYNGVDPVANSKTRWSEDYDHPELVPYIGTLPAVEYFDAQFFKVHGRNSGNMEPVARTLLEQTYQAIYDAGYSADHFAGKLVGVYMGSGASEVEKKLFYNMNHINSFSLSGCSKAMFANRVSYWLDVIGPSFSIEAGCCSSTVALEQAFKAIRRGDIEAAIVGAATTCLHPQGAVHLKRQIKLSIDGKMKCFDQNSTGCVRSEAACCFLVQKAKDALRVYSEIVYVGSRFVSDVKNENSVVKYTFYRNPDTVVEYLEEMYEKAGVSPNEVEYVEAFGAADQASDKMELEVIDRVFCKNRKKPLLVGSVRSNIGYCEAASGITSLAKLLLAYQRGVVPANLHCENPINVPALQDGRIELVTEHKPFSRAYTAICDVSYSGANCHTLLKGFYKPKDPEKYKSNIPYLVLVSGRQESSTQILLDELKTLPIDPEKIALLHNIHEEKNNGHLGRGYVILDTNSENKTISLADGVNHSDDLNRPLWFVYSGMGSQWTGMGAQLMRIPVFAAAINKCAKILAPKGLDLVNIITSNDKTIFDNILHSFVGIAAIQIGLTDVLFSMGIVPDNIIGHSVGEIGCAYADGCLSAEEMILASYSRGLVSVQTEFIRGSMAAVGIGYEKVVKLVPPEIEVACHNGPESSTISGPAEIMTEFVAKLTAQGIFAKEVPCSNIAYHSRYISQAGPKLFEYLSEVIPNPKRRSERWLSTSVPQDRWNETETQYCSAWYQTNNLLSSVLFEETSKLVPSNAVLIEVAPHGLLQAILKRSLSPDCRNIPLTKRGHPDNVVYLLEAIGKLYTEGYQPKVKALYPKIEFPVSTGTPMLSHMVSWNHTDKWSLPLLIPVKKKPSSIYKIQASIHDQEYSYLKNNIVRGKMVYPFAAVLNAVWDTLSMTRSIETNTLSVQFRDVHFYVQPILFDKKFTEVQIMLHKGTGQFEVLDGISKVAEGFIDEMDKFDWKLFNNSSDSAILNLNSEQIYSLLKEKEYSYTNEFRSIYKSTSKFDEAKMVWNNNWVTLLDGLIQLNVLKRPHDAVSEPIHIHKLTIDTKEHLNNMVKLEDNITVIPAVVNSISKYTRCGGIVIEKMLFYDFPSLYTDKLELKALEFLPRHLSNCKELDTSYQVFLQIVAENVKDDTIKITELFDNEKNITNIGNILNSTPITNIQYRRINANNALDQSILLDTDVVIVKNLKGKDNILQILKRYLNSNVFIINKENFNVESSNLIKVVSEHRSNTEKVVLGIWQPDSKSNSVSASIVRSEADLEALKAIKFKIPEGHQLIVVTPYPVITNLKELVQQWRKESNKYEISLLSVYSDKSLEQIPWKSLDLPLAFNSLKDNILGGEYYVPCKENVAVERDVTLRSKKIGDLNSLYWIEESISSDTDISVTVRYAGINSFDLNVATGMIPVTQEYMDSNSYGMDYSGTINNGNRVMGLVKGGAARGRVIAIPELMWPIPFNWTLEDAATVPLAYAQAFYCFGIKAPLLPGMTVLIHAGAGALGQAMISVALANKCEVFTTVSSVSKKKFLLKLFPKLKAENIANSRDHSFSDLVLQATDGRGCDIVVGSLSGELSNSSLACGAFCGIVLDTAQVHSGRTFTYGMNYLTKQRTYMHVDFNAIFEDKEVMKSIQLMMSEGIVRGYVQPLSRVSYAAHDVTRAFRLLAGSRHRGRVLLRMRDTIISAQPKFTCSPMYSQLIIAKDESVAYTFADSLIKCGARKLVLHLPNGTSALFNYKNELWQNLSAEVKVVFGDLVKNDAVRSLLTNHFIEGIYFISSGDQKDNEIISNLDFQSRTLGQQLKYFTIFSDGKSFNEKFCLRRAEDNLPATVIYLPTLEKNYLSGATQEVISKRIILDVIMGALRSSQRILRIHYRQSSKSILDKIMDISGINIPDDVDETKSLDDLGFDNSYAAVIAVLLKNEYYLSLNENLISKLTVKILREYDDKIKEPEFKDVKGIEKFFSYISTDEYTPAVNIYPLTTQYQHESLNDVEISVKFQYMVLIPGLQGDSEQFSSLCKRLKVPALVLQPGFDPEETVQEIAQKYVKLISLRTTNMKYNDFAIVGNEFGSLIALEVAAILEKEGKLGTVFCVGGHPHDILQAIRNEIKDCKSEAELQDAVIHHIIKKALKDVPSDLSSNLKNVSAWKDKLFIFKQAVLDRTTYSITYLQSIIDTLYRRLKEVMRYNPTAPALRSRVVVISSASSPACTGTKSLSIQPVVQEQLEVAMPYLTQHPRCATIINSNLPAEYLKPFETTNKCQMFISNTDLFEKSTIVPLDQP